MDTERRLEILGILIISLSVFILVSLTGYNPNEEPYISPNVKITNPMGILGVFTSYYFIKRGFGYLSIIIPVPSKEKIKAMLLVRMPNIPIKLAKDVNAACESSGCKSL